MGYASILWELMQIK